MATDWHLIVDAQGRSGAINMAVDYSLLQRAQCGEAFLRLYRWNPACVSFGRNEPATRRYDPLVIEQLGVDTVRRPTGGRAVWHDQEVTYAVAAPTTTFGSLRQTYWEIHRMVAAALTQLGVSVMHADAERNADSLQSGACFSSPVGGEVLVGGRKLVGSAQLREGDAFLQHGSVLLAGRQDVLGHISRRDLPPSSETSLSAALGRPVEFGEASAAIARQARTDWPGHWHAATSSPPPSSCFSFDDSAWTWRR